MKPLQAVVAVFRRLKRSRFLRSERANATIEFVILFPFFILLFTSTFEIGLLMVRQVMLDRGTDETVRTLRLGQWDIPEDDPAKQLEVHEAMKKMICEFATILPDCERNMLIALNPVETDTWGPLPQGAGCVDRNAEVNPPRNFKPGVQNEMMVIRVCALQSPMFPLAGIGAMLPRVGKDHYALVSTAAFVNEPGS
ncbi:TadE/TadG family type IV pilus assembly protein [Tropicimonas isoalkanivorans]|uniref:TadE-like protein n=1 Tax=Tropicimonas isoalkanivorans TaxID=441112 RepID=A0A1I1K2J6_9RHOB|nr:TadE/TadG family type IV pilus assembly protein [Tropicimonas isoalkanivorans]SFC55159.1 TadE-like protein [Tropicimonas isoalkanivorans]